MRRLLPGALPDQLAGDRRVGLGQLAGQAACAEAAVATHSTVVAAATFSWKSATPSAAFSYEIFLAWRIDRWRAPAAAAFADAVREATSGDA